MEITDADGNPLQPKVVTLEEIINKPSWDSADIELLVENQDRLDEETLERLGIVELVPKTEDEVKAETLAIKKKSTATAKKAK